MRKRPAWCRGGGCRVSDDSGKHDENQRIIKTACRVSAAPASTVRCHSSVWVYHFCVVWCTATGTFCVTFSCSDVCVRRPVGTHAHSITTHVCVSDHVLLCTTSLATLKRRLASGKIPNPLPPHVRNTSALLGESWTSTRVTVRIYATKL